MNTNTQQYMIPLAIIVAGGLIAAGIFFGGTKNAQKPIANDAENASIRSIEVGAVTDKDHIIGNPNADILMVEYSDTECPYCKQFHTTMHGVVEELGKDGKVAWVYRHFPIDQLHKKARKEAEATECATELGGSDGFWKYIDEVYKRTASNDKLDVAELPKIAKDTGLDVAKFNECLSSGKMASKVEEQFQDARKAGGRGTPYTVFVVKKEISDEVMEFVASSNAQFGTPPGEELITVSEDKKKVGMSGAMQPAFIRQLISILQK